jgi:Zn-dependent protease with chaperone function
METSRNAEAPAATAATLGATAHVIKAQELAPGWVMLYAVSFALALFCGAARATLVHPLLWIAFELMGEPVSLAGDVTLALGYGPLALSVATLILPLGGWWWEQRVGGRAPSERERLAFEDALASLRDADPELRSPRRWFVRDVHELNAAVYADTLMLTRGLLDSGYLEPVLAHELGHLKSSDARLIAALRRLTVPPRRRMHGGVRAVIALLFTGGLALWFTRAPWGAYWRAREHHADHYAAQLGQAAGLARFLEANALDGDLPVPFIWLTDTSHPPTEHRIERLT